MVPIVKDLAVAIVLGCVAFLLRGKGACIPYQSADQCLALDVKLCALAILVSYSHVPYTGADRCHLGSDRVLRLHSQAAAVETTPRIHIRIYCPKCLTDSPDCILSGVPGF